MRKAIGWVCISITDMTCALIMYAKARPMGPMLAHCIKENEMRQMKHYAKITGFSCTSTIVVCQYNEYCWYSVQNDYKLIEKWSCTRSIGPINKNTAEKIVSFFILTFSFVSRHWHQQSYFVFAGLSRLYYGSYLSYFKFWQHCID